MTIPAKGEFTAVIHVRLIDFRSFENSKSRWFPPSKYQIKATPASFSSVTKNKH